MVVDDLGFGAIASAKSELINKSARILKFQSDFEIRMRWKDEKEEKVKVKIE